MDFYSINLLFTNTNNSKQIKNKLDKEVVRSEGVIAWMSKSILMTI